jgi:glycosyltransferase involved in cell wall biosynthesis
MLRTPVRPEFFNIRRRPGQNPVLLFVGSVIPEKGIEILLDSFARLLKLFPDACLRILGYARPAYAAALHSVIKRAGMQDKVILCGYVGVETLVEHLSQATALVLPTFMDTAPNVIAEAQVAGVPVVASAVGGIPEMIEPGVTGFLVKPKSVMALTEALANLLDQPGRGRAMALEAQQRAQSLYDVNRQVNKLMSIYRTLLRG